jgi:hypothetical protein
MLADQQVCGPPNVDIGDHPAIVSSL